MKKASTADTKGMLFYLLFFYLLPDLGHSADEKRPSVFGCPPEEFARLAGPPPKDFPSRVQRRWDRISIVYELARNGIRDPNHPDLPEKLKTAAIKYYGSLEETFKEADKVAARLAEKEAKKAAEKEAKRIAAEKRKAAKEAAQLELDRKAAAYRLLLEEQNIAEAKARQIALAKRAEAQEELIRAARLRPLGFPWTKGLVVRGIRALRLAGYPVNPDSLKNPSQAARKVLKRALENKEVEPVDLYFAGLDTHGTWAAALQESSLHID